MLLACFFCAFFLIPQSRTEMLFWSLVRNAILSAGKEWKQEASTVWITTASSYHSLRHRIALHLIGLGNSSFADEMSFLARSRSEIGRRDGSFAPLLQ